MPGYNARLDAIQAALLHVKLKYLDDSIQERRRLAARYHELFQDFPKYEEEILWVPTPNKTPGHAFNYYVIRVRPEIRQVIQEGLKEKGIATAIYYPTPIHLLPAMGPHQRPEGSFPASEFAA
mgnify:CR=1 FL=1